MKIISVKNNCPVPRGGAFEEVWTYEMSNGSIRTKTIKIGFFRGKGRNWDEFVAKQPFDDEK